MSWWDRQAYKSTALAGAGNQGLVSTGTQIFAGDKTFNDDVTILGEATLGIASFAGAVTFEDAVTCETTLDVLGNTTLDTLTVGDSATFEAGVTCETTLDVLGNTTLDTLTVGDAATLEGTATFEQTASFQSSIECAGTFGLIRTDTDDADDDKYLAIGGGGNVAVTRGAFARYYGNEHATNPAELHLYAGNATGGEVKVFTDNEVLRARFPKDGGMAIVDDSSISTPSGANLLYSNSGALISRNSSGVDWNLNPVFADWTPTFSASTGSWSPTIDLARYMSFGKLIFCVVTLTAGAVSSTPSYLTMSLPVTVKNTSNDHYHFSIWMEWDGTTNRAVTVGQCRENTTECRIYTPTFANFTAADAKIWGSFFYEAE